MKLKDQMVRPYYIKLGEELIRTTLFRFKKIEQNELYYVHVEFKRYKVGEPNLVKIPIYFKPSLHVNLRNKKISMLRSTIDILSYNNVYPAKIKLDLNRLIRRKKYTYGDIYNTLPPGLELVNSKVLHHSVAKLRTKYSKRDQDLDYVDTQNPLFRDQTLDGKTEEEELQTKKDKKPVKKRREKSIKKIVKKDQEKLRQALAEAEQDEDNN